VAEREGFEPSVEVSPHTRLAGEHLQPTRSSLRLGRPQNLAEGVGFEPTNLSVCGFQDRRLKPLGHPSIGISLTFSPVSVNSIVATGRESDSGFWPRHDFAPASLLALLPASSRTLFWQGPEEYEIIPLRRLVSARLQKNSPSRQDKI
jgi:hypothetical protein